MIESKTQNAHAQTEGSEDQKGNSLEHQLKNLLGSSEPETAVGATLEDAAREVVVEAVTEAAELSAENSVEKSVEQAVDTLERTLASALDTAAADAVLEVGGTEKTALLSDEIELSNAASPEEVAGEVLDAVSKLGNDMGNIALDEEELETLQDLVVRYDQVVSELDVLNKQIERLLASEGIQGCES